ncbi:MAG: hypothetical protein ACKVY0_18725 [Prosthecobacter sp.]|uniref:hypothetical protein n=1 Tax=Prosthecobacter sp. TaxID=1965333 RepID=UPI003903E14F
MSFRLIIHKVSLALAVVIPSGLVNAHTDPRGEVCPLVRVDDGCFVIYTWQYDSDHSYSPIRRTIYTPDGRIQVTSEVVTDPKILESLKSNEPLPSVGAIQPKERIELDPEDENSSKNQKETRTDQFVNESRVTHQGFYLSVWQENQMKRTLLPLKSEGATGLESTLVREKELGLAWGKLSPKFNGSDRNLELMFAWLERPTVKTICELSLGECATIYDFAVTSNMLWVGDRVWMAWVRKAKDYDNLPPTKQWVTVLASIDPSAGTVKEELLDAQSHWNAHLSMNVCGNWLCLAWHCSKDGTYPGDAQIVKEFRKLK